MAKEQDVDKKWYIVDARGKTLGRLASQVAAILRGKHKPTYTPHIDSGDYVIVVNASQVRLSGKKHEQKIYYRHSRVSRRLEDAHGGPDARDPARTHGGAGRLGNAPP